ncbi:MAG: hypothetical protein ACXW0R_10635, partial [Gaiellaceae bacterium]
TVGAADVAWLVSYMVTVPQFSKHRFGRSASRVYPPKELTQCSEPGLAGDQRARVTLLRPTG